MSLGRSNSVGVLSSTVKRRPRPLKLGAANRLSAIELSSVEEVIVLIENLAVQLNRRNYEYGVICSLVRLCENLKQCGPQLENLYQEQLDKLGVAIRNACRDDELDLSSRVRLLEIIELRAMNWITNENTSTYFRQKHSQLEQDYGSSPSIELRSAQTAPISLNVNAPDFSPCPAGGSSILVQGEIIANSGRFILPTKIPGKNYFKDEIVIRNADSGKVMGLKGRRVHMIEEITETIISFQRVVPGAKERLVQITGPGPENILQAKKLIEDTIRRNQSPGREDGVESPQDTLTPDDSRRNTLLSSERERNSVSIGEYKYTVNVGDNHIKITGGSLDLVRTAKLVLDEYFSLEAKPLTADTHFEDMILSSGPKQYSKYSKSSPLIQESSFSTLARPKKVTPLLPTPSSDHNTGTKTASSIGPSCGLLCGPSSGPLSGPSFELSSGLSRGLSPEPSDSRAGRNEPSNSTPAQSPRSNNPTGIVYSRSDLLRYSLSMLATTRPAGLDSLPAEHLLLLRARDPAFNGQTHAAKGATLFRVDYVRSFPTDLDDT